MSCPKPAHVKDSNFHRIPVNDNYSEKLLPYFHEAFQFIGEFKPLDISYTLSMSFRKELISKEFERNK